MKKIKIMLIILTMGLSNGLLAGEMEKKSEDPTTLSEEIARFMKRHYIFLDEEMVVDVKFTLNDYQEIVVLSVGCDNPQIRHFISTSLNNRKPGNHNFESGKVYLLPVRLKP